MAKTRKYKTRNWIAVNMWRRGGEGSHGDGRKAASKGGCRGRFDVEDWEDEFDEDENCSSKDFAVEYNQEAMIADKENKENV